MPFPIAAAIAGGAAIAGQGIQSASTKLNNTKNFERTKDLMDKQMAQNKALAIFNNTQQMKMWEQTGPQGQMKQLAAAGLNPSLIYGMGGAGGQTAQAAQAAGVSGTSYHGENPGAGTAQTGQIVGEQLALMRAQKENIQADTANKQAGADASTAQAGKTTAETANVPKTGANIEASTASTLQGIENAKIQQQIQQLDLEKNTATFNDSIELVMRQRQLITNELEMQRRENKLSKETFDTKIKQLSANLALTLVEKAQKEQGIQESQSNIEVNKAQINQIINKVVQDWQHLNWEGRQTSEKEREGAHQRYINDMQNSFKITQESAARILQAIGIGKMLQTDRTIIQGFGKKPY